MKFKLGKTVMTNGIANAISNSSKFAAEVKNAFGRFVKCDWGDMCDEDKALNDNAIANNDERVLARYNTSIGGIYIITEYDRSYTTIMFCNEY